jgi:hypothetical protein
MKKELSLLLVEDNDGDVKIIKELLKDQTIMAFNITIAGDLADTMILFFSTLACPTAMVMKPLAS